MALLLFLSLLGATSATTTSSRKEADSVAPPGSESESSLTFTALTRPLPLYPGEVTNTWHHIAIPPGPISISEFAADIVEKGADGTTLIPVPLSEAYLHHHVVYSGHKHYRHQKNWLSPRKDTDESVHRGVGFGAGTESRGTRQVFPYPYRFTTVQGEDEFVANVHVINTRDMSRGEAHQCLECPCTGEDFAVEEIHPSSGWHWPWSSSSSKKATLHERDITAPNELAQRVIERRHHWDRCNAQLTNESNTACSPDSYSGGLLCCEHGEFCLDDYFLDSLPKPDKTTHMRPLAKNVKEDQSTFYLRYTLTYQPLTKQNTTQVTPLYLAACCDATGNITSSGNIEYDIPRTGGVHTLETIQTLHGASSNVFGTGKADKEVDKWVDVVYMVGHLHRGGMEMAAYLQANDTLLCRSLPTYGNGSIGEINNEPGYINSMSTCTFTPPLRMKTTDKIRVVGKYNATEAHTGVMSLFYIALADVDTPKAAPNENGGFFERFQRLAMVLAFVILVMATSKVAKKHYMRRDGYEQVGNHNHNLVV